MLSNMNYGYDSHSLMTSPMPMLNISGGIINTFNNISNCEKKAKILTTSPIHQSPIFKKSNTTLPHVVQKMKSPNSLNSPNSNSMSNFQSLLQLNPNSTASIINSTFSNILQVVEQESISTENVILNNRNANAHIVVKNTCFVIKIKSMDTSVLNFSNSLVKATLFYANEPLKEVNYIQTPPINYFGSASGQGEYFSLDIKISILSSQHQGNLFYIMFHINDQSRQSQFQVLSHPIRVVSKVDHIKKDGSGLLEKKQTFIDILTDRLSTLETIHTSQSNILSLMLKQRGIIGENEYICSSEELYDDDIKLFQQQQQLINNEKPKQNSKITAEKFLESFNKVIRVYKKYKEDQNQPDQNQIDNLNSNNNELNSLDQNNDNILNTDNMMTTPPLSITLGDTPLLSSNSGNSNSKSPKSLSITPIPTNSSLLSSSLELSKFIENLNEGEKSILMDLLDSFTFNENNSFNSGKSNVNDEDDEQQCVCENCPHKKLYFESQHLDPNYLVHSPQFSFQ